MSRNGFFRVNKVTKDFGGLRALNRVSVDVGPRDILGIIGPNGSGKTTLVNVSTGVLTPTSGSVEFDGQLIAGRPWAASRLGLGRTFQTPRYFTSMPVFDNLFTVALFHCSSAKASRSKAGEVVELLALGDFAAELPGSLTLEQRKRLGIGMALATGPKLVFLDEPMAGLNGTEMAEEAERILRIREAGIAVIYIEHIMAMIRKLCDRAICLDEGKLISQGAPDEVLRDPAVVSAYLGEETDETPDQDVEGNPDGANG